MPKDIVEMSATTRAFVDNEIRQRPREATLIRKLCRALRENGTPVTEVYDGAEFTKVATTADVLSLVFNLDEAYLFTDQRMAYVFVVMGEFPDTIADYTLNLESAVEPVMQWAERYAR